VGGAGVALGGVVLGPACGSGQAALLLVLLRPGGCLPGAHTLQGPMEVWVM